MSDKNSTIVEKINAAFEDGNTELFLDHCTEDVVWTMVGEGSFEGKAAVREFLAPMEGCSPPQFTVDRIIESGDDVVCFGDMLMKDEGGTDVNHSFCDVYQFQNGLVRQLRTFMVRHKTADDASNSASA